MTKKEDIIRRNLERITQEPVFEIKKKPKKTAADLYRGVDQK